MGRHKRPDDLLETVTSFSKFIGIFTVNYGKKNVRHIGSLKRYDTTCWLVYFFVPIWPLASYTVDETQSFYGNEMISRVGRPFDRSQVTRTILKALFIAALVVAIDVLKVTLVARLIPDPLT